MQTSEQDQGAASAFQLIAKEGAEDIRRFMLGLEWEPIPPLDRAPCSTACAS
jgi:hypothetical protein